MEPPGGFWESGEKGCLFSGSWGGGGHWKLFWGPGEQAHNFGNLGSPAQR